MQNVLLRYHRVLVVALHLLLIPASNYLAFWLRFDGHIPDKFLTVMLQMFPLLIILRGSVFLFYRLYQGLWRYTGILDLWSILSSTMLSALLFYVVVRFVLGIDSYPRSIFILDAMLMVFFLGGVRLPWRVHRELNRSKKGKRVLIYGAGDAGEMIVRDMRTHPGFGYEPIGFIDDQPGKTGKRIHGVPVLGTRAHLSEMIKRKMVEEVVVAVPSATPAALREIVTALEPFRIPIKTLPNLKDILEGRVSIKEIRNLSVEDLLTRVPVHLNMGRVEQFLQGKRVLVTGAGGSIGSELCRQIAVLNPHKLILVERYENGLHSIATELTEQKYSSEVIPVLADIIDKEKIKAVLREHKPDVVFHAAAHKHVPLMEENPCEAIKNNVTGTRIVARAALENQVERFVFISSDKAVNPTSVMGASKQIGELIVQIMAKRGSTSFVSVRFGNVLGSNGSVIPKFLEQIRTRQPLTVTHPDMRRYFMLIPEAVHLVLVAASMEDSAQTYVLEMGEQIRVIDMARNLIQLAGLIPEEEIPIVYTGIRPGEKLSEELIADDEIAEPSEVSEIRKIRSKSGMDIRGLIRKIRYLEMTARKGNPNELIPALISIVPSFKPDGNPQSANKVTT